MPILFDTLMQRLTGRALGLISQQIGADEASTRRAMAVTLPLLIGGLARSSNESHSAANALVKTLAKDHDGSLFDNIEDFLTRSGGGGSLTDAGNGQQGNLSIHRRSADGDGILRHVLGEKRRAVELGISKAAGLEVRMVGTLLRLLAPVVMSALGRMHRENKFDADGVARLLNRERAELERATPEMRRGGLMDYLDPEDEGELAEFVARIGSRFCEGHMTGKTA